MEKYRNNYLSELDYSELNIEMTINDFIKGWGTDEMIELLGECEFALSQNEGRVEQLKAKGLKRLYNIITGINRKNKQIVIDNVQEIQKISFKIQKILMKRIDLVSDALRYLNNKVNMEIFWTQDVIKSLIHKLENVPEKTHLLWLRNNISNMETKSGKKYIDVSDGIKILLVVSELFQIVKDQIGLVEKPFLKTILDELKLHDDIDTWNFYDDIINNREYLSLYVKNEYDYSTVDISYYGQMIYKIYGFYSNSYMIEFSKNINRSLESICKENYEGQIRKENNKISSFDLCLLLLKDLAGLDFEYQIRIENQKMQESEKISTDFDEYQKNANEKIEYSVLKITPEGFWRFKKGDNTKKIKKIGKNYTFSYENSVKTELENFKPYIVIIPIGYPDKCNSEIKSIIKKGKYLSLADYYMYLWFQYKNESERKNKKLAFIEYYDHVLYVSGYAVNALGNEYKKGYSKFEIPYNRTRSNIIKDIKDRWKTAFPDLYGNDITIFRTFQSDKWIAHKLDDVDVEIVDTKWEDILKGNSNDLGNIIQDMIKRSDVSW